jgi:hypothetical protein
VVCLTTSCRSTRKISQAMVRKDSAVVITNPEEADSARLVREALDKISKNHIDFNTFSAKVKVDYQDSRDRKYDFNAFFRIQKDSVIWISIIAALGIEAFRIMITPDSVLILDKLNKTYESKSVSYLQEIAKLPFDFKTLQDLIIGNPVYIDGDITSYKQQENAVVMSTMGSFFKHFMTFSKDDFNLLFSKLDDVDLTRSRTANLTYEDYQTAGTWRFSNSRRITIAENTKLDIDMVFKQVEFDKPQNYPFQIPKNYKIK